MDEITREDLQQIRQVTLTEFEHAVALVEIGTLTKRPSANACMFVAVALDSPTLAEPQAVSAVVHAAEVIREHRIRCGNRQVIVAADKFAGSLIVHEHRENVGHVLADWPLPYIRQLVANSPDFTKRERLIATIAH